MTNTDRMRYWRGSAVAPCVCTVALLLGLAAKGLLLAQPWADAERYHAGVREAVASVPLHFGSWLGEDIAVPPGAVKLLKPNVILSRRYVDMGTGRSVTVLVVHCKDARDILGHYPPICYPAQGWALDPIEPPTSQEWMVDSKAICGMRYTFQKGQPGDDGEVVVDNFMVLPVGRTFRDMDEVGRAAAHSKLKNYGAGQVQLVYDARLSADSRREICNTFLHELQPMISAIILPVEEKHP